MTAQVPLFIKSLHETSHIVDNCLSRLQFVHEIFHIVDKQKYWYRNSYARSYASTAFDIYGCRMLRRGGAGSNIPEGLSSRRPVL